jgi:hypothetical protein
VVVVNLHPVSPLNGGMVGRNLSSEYSPSLSLLIAKDEIRNNMNCVNKNLVFFNIGSFGQH